MNSFKWWLHKDNTLSDIWLLITYMIDLIDISRWTMNDFKGKFERDIYFFYLFFFHFFLKLWNLMKNIKKIIKYYYIQQHYINKKKYKSHTIKDFLSSKIIITLSTKWDNMIKLFIIL